MPALHFEALVQQHAGLLRRVIARTGLDVCDRDDAYSEALLAIHLALPSFDPARGKLHSYVAKVAENTARMHRRANRRHSTHQVDVIAAEPDHAYEVAAYALSGQGADPDASDALIRLSELDAAVRAELSGRARAVYAALGLEDLHAAAGAEYAALAADLGCGPDSVRHAVREARQAVQRLWGRYFVSELPHTEPDLAEPAPAPAPAPVAAPREARTPRRARKASKPARPAPAPRAPRPSRLPKPARPPAPGPQTPYAPNPSVIAAIQLALRVANAGIPCRH